jgi:hypothetical protein
MIVFKPNHHEFAPFPGFEPGLIPIFPSEGTFSIDYRHNHLTKVHQRQYPMCGGYAFTDHKAQGQTLPYAVIDIAPTPQFAVTPFMAYVALSRSRGRQTIRLLRDFDDKIFTTHPSSDLRAEDARLKQLAEDTANKYEMGYYNYE